MTDVDWERIARTYTSENMLKFLLPLEDDKPEKRVYILWLVVKVDAYWETGAYWETDAEWVKDIIGGVFESEDRANFARDIYQHRADYVSSYIQSVKLNELLWKVKE